MRGGGVAGAAEHGAKHGAVSESPGAGVGEPVVGAVEPSGRPPPSAVLEAVQSQVPKSAERDNVLDAGRHLASGAHKTGVRPTIIRFGRRNCLLEWQFQSDSSQKAHPWAYKGGLVGPL